MTVTSIEVKPRAREEEGRRDSTVRLKNSEGNPRLLKRKYTNTVLQIKRVSSEIEKLTQGREHSHKPRARQSFSIT